MMTRVLLVLVLILAIAGCGERREAREIYNRGAAALEQRDLEEATKLLLEARSKAGVDPELRFRAAFDLGVAFAAQSDKVKAEDLAKALDLAGQALSWFGDAVRQRPDDADARTNQGILRARVQALSDELRKAEGKLEARLDAVIGEQRGVLDGTRAAWLAIKKAGGADPLAEQPKLAGLADGERAIVAEVGAISDLASDEIDAIGKKPEDQRSDEEKVRVVQLRGLDIYLLEARARIAEARRKLQELATEDALARAEAAMVALKRAREQLLDPITVMRLVARDQLELVGDTLGAGAGGKLRLDAPAPTPEAAAPWRSPAVLAERQGTLHDRLEEVRARLAAATAPPAPEAAGAAPPAPSPEQAKVLERVKLALPFVQAAVSAMEAARRELAGAQLEPALAKEREALEALARAIEEFADLKQTIELAYADQELISTLLSPEAAKLPAAERGEQTRDALARNTGRAERLKERIAEAAAQLAQQAQQLEAQAAQAGAGAGAGAGGAAAGSGAGSGAGSAAPAQADAARQQLEAAKQQLEAEKEKLARAEELRGQYRAALARLDQELAGRDPATPAAEARQKIGELRKLFFSVIEHLEQLIRDQGDTRDRTSEAHAADPLSREPRLPELIGRQEQHGAMAKAITEALAAQADAAGKQPPQQGAPDAKALSGAANEVRDAQRAMADAVATVTRARDAKTSSESLEPALKSQATAIEHLEKALELLKPPKQQQQQQDPQQDQQQEQQQQQQQQQRGGQAARDQDAQQQKKRRELESRDPVEKDW